MEKKHIVIQTATLNDAVSIALLGRITFTETFGHLFSDQNDILKYLEKTFSVDKIRKGINKKENVFLIAFLDNLPVGYGKLKLNTKNDFLQHKNICQLQKIYLLKDFLSLGIGKQLHDSLLQSAIEKGYSFIWLSVLDSNQKAIDFYLNFGYHSVGKHGYFIGKDDFELFVLHKTLN